MYETKKIDPKSRIIRLKGKLKSILGITIFWLILGFYQYFDRYSILADKNLIDESYEHWPFIRGLITSTILAGLFLAPSLVFLWEKWFRRLAFSHALSYIILCYIALYIVITFISTLLFAHNDPSILIDQNLFKTVLNTLFNLNTLPNFLFWLFVLLLTMSFFLIRDKFGHRTFSRFIRGKYFHPRREERVFLFMDLNSATSIAEKLGEKKYFNFLNDTFKLATSGILETNGEIYQYVGDEIVISWDKNEGIRDINCIRCYFEIVKSLKEHSKYFQSNYEVIPQFKAGLHSGFVIAGEIGIIKSDIVYSGDVLNTASRIQSLCNSLDVDILISKNLADQINESFGHNLKSMGDSNLKGKKEKIELFTIKFMDEQI